MDEGRKESKERHVAVTVFLTATSSCLAGVCHPALWAS